MWMALKCDMGFVFIHYLMVELLYRAVLDSMMKSNVNKLDPSWRFTRKDPTWSFLNLNHTTELLKAQQLINWADLDWGKKIFISRHNNRDNNSTDSPSENRNHKYSRSTLITVTRSDSAPRCKSVWDLLLPPLTRREKKQRMAARRERCMCTAYWGTSLKSVSVWEHTGRFTVTDESTGDKWS